MPTPHSLAGRIALVTGGASGLGRGAAEAAAAAGAHVVIADIDEAGGRTVAGALAGSFVALEGDFDPAQLRSNPFDCEWPPRSGKVQAYPEIDRATWATLEEARVLLLPAQCEFLAPAVQGDRCEVRSRIARFGGKSFTVEHEIVRSDGTPLAKAQETRVWGRYVNGPGTPLKGETIPDDVKARFRAPSPSR